MYIYIYIYIVGLLNFITCKVLLVCFGFLNLINFCLHTLDLLFVVALKLTSDIHKERLATVSFGLSSRYLLFSNISNICMCFCLHILHAQRHEHSYSMLLISCLVLWLVYGLTLDCVICVVISLFIYSVGLYSFTWYFKLLWWSAWCWMIIDRTHMWQVIAVAWPYHYVQCMWSFPSKSAFLVKGSSKKLNETMGDKLIIEN